MSPAARRRRGSPARVRRPARASASRSTIDRERNERDAWRGLSAEASTMRGMAVAQETLEQLRRAGLADLDPEIARLLEQELERQRGQIELIASENFTWPSVFEAVGSVPTNKYAEGYPGPALLRRLRGRRRDRADRDRPRQGAVRRRARERPAARGRADEHGRLHGRAASRATRSSRSSSRTAATSRTGSRSTSRAGSTRSSTTASRARRTWSTTTRCSGSRRSTGRS